MKNRTYDEFPVSLVLLCVSVNILIYIIGAFIVASLNVYALSLYILYCLWMEARLLSNSCRYCDYYGKLCAFGKGKICSWFFKKRSEDRLKEKISFYDLIPDFLVSLIPLVAGVYIIVRSFSWFILGLIIALLILAFPFTGYVRGSIACKFCRQKENGCGAIQLFEKDEQRI